MQCEICGNCYDRAFVVRMDGVEHVFDSFECAIQALAPTCARCGCRIVGHGLEKDGTIYCCAHCARHDATETSLKDREDSLSDKDISLEARADALVGEASEESFPASDPPAWSSDRA